MAIKIRGYFGVIVRVFSTTTAVKPRTVIFRRVPCRQLRRIKVERQVPSYANVHMQHRPILLIFSCVKILAEPPFANRGCAVPI